MKRNLFLMSSICLLLAACDHMTGTGTSSQSGHNSNNPANYSADNTGRNVRDRNNQTLTSGDQSESEIDRTITQRIRQSLMDDDSLSTNAKNIKIITIREVVTLRGPVNNEKEKNEIAKKAKAINGVKSIDNQLEVSQQDRDGNFNSGMRNDSMRNDRDMNR